MSPKVSIFIATSLDGFIARKDGSLDWLDQANAAVSPGEDCGFRTFMDSVDVLVMGRITFEQVLTFGQVYVDGGITIQRFHQAGLIDEITMTLSPTEQRIRPRTRDKRPFIIKFSPFCIYPPTHRML